MNREAVEKRLEELRSSFEQAISNANAIQGAIQDCEYWLKIIEEEAEKSASNSESV